MRLRGTRREFEIAVLIVLCLALVALIVVAFHRVNETPSASGDDGLLTPSSVVSASPTLPADPKLLIVGDSYTQGYAADPESHGYAFLLGKKLGWDTRVDGIGGTGFTTRPAGPAYIDRIKARAGKRWVPDLVILEGGQNDSGTPVDQVTAAVEDTVKQVRAQWPDAKVLVFGPMAPLPLGDQLADFSTEICAAGQDQGAQFVNPQDLGWITEDNTDEYNAGDGSHLNTAGHAYVADKLAAQVRSIYQVG